jgi:hypothetical protein
MAVIPYSLIDRDLCRIFNNLHILYRYEIRLATLPKTYHDIIYTGQQPNKAYRTVQNLPLGKAFKVL